MEARYTPTIMDGAVLRIGFGYDRGKVKRILDDQEHTEWSGEISASRNGVSMHGTCPVYQDEKHVGLICDAFQFAWRVYQRMKNSTDPHAVCKRAVEEFNHDHALLAHADERHQP